MLVPSEEDEAQMVLDDMKAMELAVGVVGAANYLNRRVPKLMALRHSALAGDLAFKLVRTNRHLAGDILDIADKYQLQNIKDTLIKF